MTKVKTMEEAYRVFELLGIKDVTKKWQKKQGTEVFELPFKTMYYNGQAETNRFSIYKSGYVRKMVVHPTSNASYSCYQLNKTRKSDEYFKDYDYDGKWTGKYRKSNRTERIMIDTHRDRVVYLCNYILKNYYRNGKMNLVGEYTTKRVAEVHGEWWRGERYKVENTLPFDGDEHDLVRSFEETVERDGFIDDNEIQVIINGHRYNLS
tara:strand:+ start:74 stop:697 length:624 start_codon:yes stop_codon:yes gene_type:complete